MQIDMLKAQVIVAKAKKTTKKTIFSGSQISCYQKKLNNYGLNKFFFLKVLINMIISIHVLHMKQKR